jgi:hypothetical protein
MRSRRLMFTALLAVGALLLAACGDDSESSSDTTEAPAATTTEAPTATTEATATTVGDVNDGVHTMTLDVHEGIADGDTIAVEVGGFDAGAELTMVTCFVFPATGPESCDLSNYGDFAAPADADGAAAMEYTIKVGDLDGGACDADNPCFIVVGDGFGPDAGYAAHTVAFG